MRTKVKRIMRTDSAALRWQTAHMMTKSDVAARLKAIRERAGLSIRATARALGVESSTYNHYERRYKKPFLPRDFAEDVAAVFAHYGIPAEDVLALAGSEASDSAAPATDRRAMVPIYDVQASAGHGALNGTEAQSGQMAFTRGYLREMTNAGSASLAVIRVRGDSMEDTLHRDDIVLVDKTRCDLDRDGIFVLRLGDELLVKRIGRSRQRDHVLLISDNKVYPAIDLPRAEIDDVIGEVIWFGRQL